jgi:putative spermidine/putrescine transport system ATP-binding protein
LATPAPLVTATRPSPDAAPAAVSLRGVVKRFEGDVGRRVARLVDGGRVQPDAVVAVAGVDLDVQDGEFFSMLGPSGSGKTTTLRMIAGFEQPTEGRILLHGVDVTDRPPFERDVNTVFQDYALFPHMSIGENVAYGLTIRKVPRPERERRVAETLEMVRLAGYERRKPSQLSGGQRQRVALARALINRPRVLLLDEPLGALDLKLREEMQIELKGIQDEVEITFIYVTHDQQEALSMSDRIAVFEAGRIEQVGTPAELYARPATAFVAGFVGTSNFATGATARELFGADGSFAIRPERITIGGPEVVPEAGLRAATGRLREVLFLGSESRFVVDLDAGPTFIVTRPNLGRDDDWRPEPGRAVRLTWQPADVLQLATVQDGR